MGSGASRVVEDVKVAVDPTEMEIQAGDAIKAKRFDKALPMLQVMNPQRWAGQG
jgi:hypothetical protein